MTGAFFNRLQAQTAETDPAGLPAPAMSHGHSHSHGGGHSHDEEYPDDDWNLYQHLDCADALNGVMLCGDHDHGMRTSWAPHKATGEALCVFKPHALRLDQFPALASDVDEQLLVKVQFAAPVSVRKLMVVGAGPASGHPSAVRCYAWSMDSDET